MKKTMKKIVALGSGAVLLVSASVMGTMAYLTSQDAVTNTFTVGNVAITLDEAQVDANGVYVNGHDTRVKENSYKLMPGHTYQKDPTVTVKAGSEESYVRMLVTVSDIGALKNAFPEKKYAEYYANDVFLLQQLVGGWDSTNWTVASVNDNVYEFRYKETVSALNGEDVVLDDLFETITIPGTVTNSELAELNNVQISVVAHAIQKDGFGSAADAWAKWTTK